MRNVDYKKVLLTILVVLSLQGCVAMVGGAAIGATGATMVYDRRDLATMLHDRKISNQILEGLASDVAVKKQCHVVVAVYHKMVLIAGQAPTTALKAQVSEIARYAAPSAKHIYNEMSIEGSTAALIRTSDAWITTKVKAKLLTTKQLKSGQFKVVTENGTVFLMGVVKRSQADMAVNVVKHVEGVQRVVKIFQYKR